MGKFKGVEAGRNQTVYTREDLKLSDYVRFYAFNENSVRPSDHRPLPEKGFVTLQFHRPVAGQSIYGLKETETSTESPQIDLLAFNVDSSG